MKKTIAVKDALKATGLRVTGARQKVLLILHDSKTPLSAEDVLRTYKGDVVTVYRTLNALSRAGLLREVRFKDGIIRYEILEESQHHHHAVCTSCGFVEELPACHLDVDIRALSSARNFNTIQHSLEFYGTCRACTV